VRDQTRRRGRLAWFAGLTAAGDARACLANPARQEWAWVPGAKEGPGALRKGL